LQKPRSAFAPPSSSVPSFRFNDIRMKRTGLLGATSHKESTYVVGNRTSITVAMDWTDFDADNQATIMLSLLCGHGRATLPT
jgi:hypothetical protein